MQLHSHTHTLAYKMATAVTPFPPFALSRDLCLIVAWRIQFACVCVRASACVGESAMHASM